MTPTTRSHSESREHDAGLAAAARSVRREVVKFDLLIDRLERMDGGLSRAEVVEAIAELDGLGARLSVVADRIEHVAP